MTTETCDPDTSISSYMCDFVSRFDDETTAFLRTLVTEEGPYKPALLPPPTEDDEEEQSDSDADFDEDDEDEEDDAAHEAYGTSGEDFELSGRDKTALALLERLKPMAVLGSRPRSIISFTDI